MKNVIIASFNSLLNHFFNKSDQSYLSRLFLPNTTYVDVMSSIVTNQENTIIAPFDAWFVLGAKTKQEDNIEECSCCVWGNNNSCIDTSAYSKRYHTQAKCFIPVAKGAIIKYIIRGNLHMARFYPLFGQQV